MEKQDNTEGNVFPGGNSSDATDLGDCSKENIVTGGSLYPDLQQFQDTQETTSKKVEKNKADKQIAEILHNNLSRDRNNKLAFGEENRKLESYPHKISNNLSVDKLDGTSRVTTALTSRQCNDVLIKKEKRAKRKRKHIKTGYKVLAFTIGLPITIPYHLLFRTPPHEEDDDIKGDFEQMTNSTIKLFQKKDKSKAKKLNV